VPGIIRNRNTRATYMVAVSWFLAWCEQNQLGQNFEKPTVKQHLAGSGCCSIGWSLGVC
jgi:hypothetical protein